MGYDTLRGTTGWSSRYGGRGIIDDSYLDAKDGSVTAEMKRQHNKALRMGDAGWEEHGRLTAYAGTSVGPINSLMSARDILHGVRRHAANILNNRFSSCL